MRLTNRQLKQLTLVEAEEMTTKLADDLQAYIAMPETLHIKLWRLDVRLKKQQLIQLAEHFVIAERSLRAVNQEYEVCLAKDETDIDPCDWYFGDDNND